MIISYTVCVTMYCMMIISYTVCVTMYCMMLVSYTVCVTICCVLWYDCFVIFQCLHVCTVHQWRLKHFIIQQMHKYIIRRYSAFLDSAVHTHSASLDSAVHTHSASLDSAVHTRTNCRYTAITPTMSMSADTIEQLL